MDRFEHSVFLRKKEAKNLFAITVNWKTVAALGASIVGIVLAAKVDKNDAKSALEHFAEVVFAPKHVITESED